jgi:phosphate uptake regulator
MVNIRRLQRTGGKEGSSFLIIVPKEWVVRQELEKGDPVVVAEREDGCLIIDPRLPKSGETRSTTVMMESNLRWAITSKYLLGFDEIRIISKKVIENAERDAIKQIISRFVALEITDEEENQIVVQCLVNPSTLPVHQTMRRMNLIATRMLNEALEAYFEGDKKRSIKIQQQDEEVDRLFFLIVRELRLAIQYPRMSETMNISPVTALDFRLASQYIERIADLAVDIAAKTDKPLKTSARKSLENIVDKVKEMLTKSVANLFRFDSEKVAWVIKAEKELINDIAKYRQKIITESSGEAQIQLEVVDSLLRIGEAAKDIADLALPQN